VTSLQEAVRLALEAAGRRRAGHSAQTASSGWDARRLKHSLRSAAFPPEAEGRCLERRRADGAAAPAARGLSVGHTSTHF